MTVARLAGGPYRVASGDILQLEMPVVMRALAPEATVDGQSPGVHACRVSASGKLTLPTVGEIEAAGKSLGEIEAAAVAAYYPRYTVRRPAIVATVREHSTVKVSVTGAVANPGIHSLTSDERSLVGALMKAGGIVGQGASAVRVLSPGEGAAPEPVVLPVEDLNIPFLDVPLKGGEVVEVRRLDPQVFTVVGLVAGPGTFPYPPGARYSLLHALGFSGGLDPISSPRFVQVLRQDANGDIVTAMFDLDEGYEKAAALQIKQGDIIAVVETSATQFNRLTNTLLQSFLVQGALYAVLNSNN